MDIKKLNEELEKLLKDEGSEKLENSIGKKQTMTILKLKDYQEEVFNEIKDRLAHREYFQNKSKFNALTDEQIKNVIEHLANHRYQYNTKTGITTLDGEWYEQYSNKDDIPSENEAVEEFIYNSATNVLGTIGNEFFDVDTLTYKRR